MNIEKRPQITADDELREICKRIVAEGKSAVEWDQIESDDMFQSSHYEGGYDATEQEFLFSYHDHEGKEWWISFSLEIAEKIAAGKEYYLDLYEPH